MSLTLKIPESVEIALKLPTANRQQELLGELALALYARGILSFGKACELTPLSRFEFGSLLARRQIPRHYGEEELDEDLVYALLP